MLSEMMHGDLQREDIVLEGHRAVELSHILAGMTRAYWYSIATVHQTTTSSEAQHYATYSSCFR